MNKILIVEDDPSQRRTIASLARQKLGLDSIEAAHGQEALSLLREDRHKDVRLVILDLHMPEMNGIELLKIVMQQYPKLPVIMLTGTDDVDMAVKTMKLGAYDFFRKPLDPGRFEISVRNALKLSFLEKEVIRLKRKEDGAFNFEDLIGHNSGLSPAVNMGRKAASADIPVLLSGETGVGKEVFARAIHGESHRAGKHFMAVNCGAIPRNLIESTLFGHEKGAFTGAISKSLGYFREAEGGTIFLDEIGELPLDAQVKLLRVLQEKEVHPVGSGKSIPVNVRIISATNSDLEKDISAGRFRNDLYFRLNVLPICLPALREREKDIPALIRHFIGRFSAIEGRPLRDITPEAEKILINRNWNGNIRELENMIHRTMVLCENDVIDVNDLSSLSISGFFSTNAVADFSQKNSLCMFESGGKLKTMDQIEQDAMQFALKYHEKNITQAARSLNIAKSTFYRKLKSKN